MARTDYGRVVRRQAGTSRRIGWNALVDIHDPQAIVDEPVVWEFSRGNARRERRGYTYGTNVRDTSVVEPKTSGRSEEPR